MIIRAIVEADNLEDALVDAEEIFDRLTEGQDPFDYYQTFEGPGTSVSGAGRWGKMPAALRLDTLEGQQMVTEGMQSTLRDRTRALAECRKALETYTDRELALKDDARDLAHCHFSVFGEYEGPSIWLYDQDGCGIRTIDHLRSALRGWKHLGGPGKPSEELAKRWVVPADVHH